MDDQAAKELLQAANRMIATLTSILPAYSKERTAIPAAGFLDMAQDDLYWAIRKAEESAPAGTI